MTSLRFTPTALALGLFLAITFTLCVLWGLLVPHTLLQREILEVVFPGFTWLSGGSFILGLVESFLYGVYTAVLFVPLYSVFNRRTGASSPRAA